MKKILIINGHPDKESLWQRPLVQSILITINHG